MPAPWMSLPSITPVNAAATSRPVAAALTSLPAMWPAAATLRATPAVAPWTRLPRSVNPVAPEPATVTPAVGAGDRVVLDGRAGGAAGEEHGPGDGVVRDVVVGPAVQGDRAGGAVGERDAAAAGDGDAAGEREVL